MSIDIYDRVLRIQRGMEQKFHVSNEICCEHSFMYPAFLQAQRALNEIIQHTKAFYQDGTVSQDKENRLFEYGGNIILFAAPRGGGKTRTMLSFSHILDNPNAAVVCCALNGRCENCKHSPTLIADSAFCVTAPIAPTVLENGQNVLYVVLSRLYRYAETLLLEKCPSGRISERQKNDLYIAFNRCMAGINGLKKNSSSPEDFSILQEISDGLSLRDHFYELVTKLLEIAAPHKTDATRYLVLQFDDADSKIDNAFAVFEDIRKYLLIPNLVILMSADLDSLHKVITQDYLKQFTEVIHRVDPGYAQNLAHIARKYIDKLIPPSHLINLPSFGKLSIAEIRQLKLLYLDEKGEPVLTSDQDGVDGRNSNLDDLVLKLVYNKTGIIFARPATYLHNLIPWTPRGLNQLLNFLVEMEDIPRILSYSPASKFVEQIAAQCKIAQRNIALFSDYFVNDWIKVKIRSFEDQSFFVRFLNIRPAERIKEAILFLLDRFKDGQPTLPEAPNIWPARYDLYFLNQLMNKLLAELCTQDEYLLLFAIHTLLTIGSHRLIWERKNEIVRQFCDDRRTISAITNETKRKRLQSELEKTLIVFPFASEDEIVTSIMLRPSAGKPNPYLRQLSKQNYDAILQVERENLPIYEAIGKLSGLIREGMPIKNALESCKDKFGQNEITDMLWKDLFSYVQERPESETDSKETVEFVVAWLSMQQRPYAEKIRVCQIAKILCSSTYTNVYELNIMNVFLLLQQLDDAQIDIATLVDGIEELKDNPEKIQQEVYQLQECALRITANWDVLKKIYGHTCDLTSGQNNSPTDASTPFNTLFKDLLVNLQKLVPALYDANEVLNSHIMRKLCQYCSEADKLVGDIVDQSNQRVQEEEFFIRLSQIKGIGEAAIRRIREKRLVDPSLFVEDKRAWLESLLGKNIARVLIDARNCKML